ncbi:heavy metal translocating P-type ATPase [Bacteriovorax stolpii]|uniref:P-type Zn(2+) transporter n=1 Tax=Bacteriovorax stolpii TaxID=960 RepID=A0A2K9NUD3_BACTC|nr:cation-translocating P-type ATPase [Bacteriovorax stolpii]AUN99108.1 heavy metal translocating P-type ATPase [Bacteriovorax stolpii]TDP55360.1 Cd2+/Zn2+-exporting ATPase [Bacteriovorax stolpii]
MSSDHTHSHKNHDHGHDSCCAPAPKPVHKHAHDNCCSAETPLAPQKALAASNDEILTKFKVANMDCPDEIKAINESLKMTGVFKIQANLMSGTVEILHSPDIHKSFLRKKIDSTVVKVLDDESPSTIGQNQKRIWTVAISGVLLLAGLVLQWMNVVSVFESILLLVSIVLSGSLVFPKALASIKRKYLDMNVLMTVAAIGAIAIKEYSEAAAVVFLFALSELLESLSVQRARRAIQELLKIAPQKALLILEDGSTKEVEASEVQISQLIRVKPGDVIPVDGEVIKGHSSVNQAPLTGESLPVEKSQGETVYTGTINQEGSLDVKVTKAFSDTKISQVIKMVEEAQEHKAVSQKFVDRFAEIYTPAVLVVAILTFLIPPAFFGGSWHDWLYKSLVLLVIACPCALVISTPVSIVSGLTALARRGVLVKGGVVLESLGKIKALAVDKTGTLTEGKLKVEKVVTFNSFSEKQALEIARAMESHSTHPIAQAIVTYADDKITEKKIVDRFSTITGFGVEGIIEGHSYLLGNHRFAHDVGICTPELENKLRELEDEAYSIVIIGHKPHDNCKGEVLCILALKDAIRKESKDSILELKASGVERVILLSGDNQKTVSSLTKDLPLDEAHGELLPEDKVKHIESLKTKYQSVAMIGDGINDAPAMAKASIGIAMGFVGSDTAIETSDVTLMTDDLKQVSTAIKAGRRTLSIIQFNIFFALVTKAIFLVLTLLGYSNLWLAVAADTGAALLVILNSLRLLRI